MRTSLAIRYCPRDGLASRWSPHRWIIVWGNDLFDWVGRDPTDDGEVGDILGYDRVGANDAAFPNTDTRHDHNVVAKHGVGTDLNRIEELEAVVSDAGTIARRWLAAVTLDEWCGPAMWAHGDLHPLNLLQRDDRLAAVLDFGDVTSGDPANDLSVAWMLFDAGDREVFRAAAATPVRPIDETTWERARAWALSTAVLFLQASADNPALHRVGEFTLAAVLADYAD